MDKEEILKLVTAEYNLPKIKKANSIEQGLFCQEVYRLITVDKDYVLRIRPGYFTPDQIKEDHKFIEYLGENNFPVPNIIFTRKGESLLQQEKTILEVQTYIPHQKTAADYNYQEIGDKLIDFLAAYQQLVQKYNGEINKPSYIGKFKQPVNLKAFYFTGALDYGILRYRRIVKLANVGIKEELLNHLDYFKNKLEVLQSLIMPQLRKIPTVVNHNDFRGNNVLFNNGEISGLIDFDFCYTGIYYVDLIEVLHSIMIWEGSQLSYWGLPEKGKIDLDAGSRILDFYLERSNLPFDFEICRDLLAARTISQVFQPAGDIIENIEKRLKVLTRLKKIIDNLERWGIRS